MSSECLSLRRWLRRIEIPRAISRRNGLGFVLVGIGLLQFLGSLGAANDVPKSVQNRLSKVVGFFESGNSIGVIGEGGKLLQQLAETELKNVNDLLKQQNKLTLQAMLVESRMDLDRPGVSAKFPAPTHKEAIYLAWEIKDRVAEIEDQFLSHPVCKGDVSAPKIYNDYEKHFWDLHVFRNQLTNASRWLRETEKLLRSREKRLAGLKISDSTMEILKYDFQKRIKDFDGFLLDLEEREAFLRIFRIHDTIGNDIPAATEKDKYTFAYFVEADVLYLESFFKRFENVSFSRGDLNDRSILSEVSEEALGIREKYADKIKKAKMLFLGMHWWFRGRYGSGPIAKGLLKAPGAHLAEKHLFPLAMPTVAPKPLDPYTSDYRIPHYERRHHYTWQVQQEQVYKYQKPMVQRSVKQQVAADPNVPQYRKFY